jgi:hypothetical protein
MNTDNLITVKINGGFMFAAPLHGNLNDMFKHAYMGYTKKQALKKFENDFNQAESKVFINTF